MIGTLLELGSFLVAHADLIQDIAEAIAHGTPKEAIKAAIRVAKVQASDAAFKEELGV